MSDAEGRIVWQATFKAWGEMHSLDVGEVEQNLRYQGQYFDAESGLHYNTFRYYDPKIGRFTTQDPIGIDGGDNLYAYAPNSNRWIDPLGWVHESTGGYNVYGLFDKGAEKPYYVGITDDLSRRRMEHSSSGRLTRGTELRPLDKGVTYGQARGYEQAYIEHYETKTGVIGQDISASNRGNKINSFDHGNATRSPNRQVNFESNFENKTNSLKGAC